MKKIGFHWVFLYFTIVLLISAFGDYFFNCDDNELQQSHETTISEEIKPIEPISHVNEP